MQFDFQGVATVMIWLRLTTKVVTLCLTDTGYSGSGDNFPIIGRHISYQKALNDCEISVEGIPSLIHAFLNYRRSENGSDKE
jgi:hypothetical protein